MKGSDKLFLLLLGLFSCMAVSLRAQGVKRAFALPAVPDTLKGAAMRASYLVAHYWDDFVFSDSLQYLNAPEEIEQALVNYIDLFRLLPEEEVESSLRQVMRDADITRSGVFFFYNAFEKYLYDLGSPMRDENRFIPVLEGMIASRRVGEDDKIRPEMLLKSVSKNKLGSVAADFTYAMADESRHQLHALESPLTFLLFFDPDCDECHQVIKQLESAGWLSELIQQKRLALLAIYPGGNVAMWKAMQANLPKHWIVGYDAGGTIYDKELYDILGFPTMFLLDEHKRVLLKDASPEEIENYMKSSHRVKPQIH